MVLSDRTIKELIAAGRIIIKPFDPACIQPASVDIHLGNKFLVFRNTRRPYIDVRQLVDDITEEVIIDENTPLVLHPGEFILASTYETLTLPDDLMARVEGKSSLGRLGLLIHSTAGFVDPGWSGTLTLELSNVATLPIMLYFGMKIGHISFTRLTTSAEIPYGSKKLGSKYQGQDGPAPSKSYLDFQLPLESSLGTGASSDVSQGETHK